MASPEMARSSIVRESPGRRKLRDGDVIVMGSTSLYFHQPVAHGDTTRPVTPAPELSRAQRRVLVALCRPMITQERPVAASNQEIADELVISVETVKNHHLRKLFELFGVADLPQNQKRAELINRALSTGAVVAADYENAPGSPSRVR